MAEKSRCQRCGLKRKVRKVSGFYKGYHHIMACDACIKELEESNNN